MGRLGPGWLALLVLAWIAISACASSAPRGTTHVVRPGENLYRLSRYYGVPSYRIQRANRIRDVADIPVGQRLVIPGARRAQPGHSLAPVMAAVHRPSAAEPSGSGRPEAGLALSWPVRGRVSSGFGWRGRRRHEGIDIPARPGTAIFAAESGRVVHSGGNLGDYGRVVILKHAGPYQTVYAHNRRNLVRKGQFVEKGQVIAEVGSSGNASGPHLHFEVRRDRRPRDPLRYLP